MGDRDWLFGMDSAKPLAIPKKNFSVIMCFETDTDAQIPLLWSALFQKSDVSSVRLRRGKEDGGGTVAIPVWHVSRESAMENFKARKPWIFQHVHSSLHPFVEAFEEGISNCKYSYIQLGLYALFHWLEGDRAVFRERVETGLAALESEEAMVACFGQPPIRNTYKLYGMNFLFSDWCNKPVWLEWYRVGEDNRIIKDGCPGGAWIVGDFGEKKPKIKLPLFFWGCVYGDLPAVKSLLQSGQDVNARVDLPKEKEVTGLILATGHGKTDVVRELIKAGADVNAQSESGAFALGLAAEDGHVEIVKALLTAGADVNMKNKDGWDAMMMAVIYQHFDVQKLLSDAGAGVQQDALPND